MKMNATLRDALVVLFILTCCCCGKENDWCPKGCTCKRVSPQGDSTWYKLRCGDAQHRIARIEEINFGRLASDVIQMNLSSNLIIKLPHLKFPNLQKIDLSKNQIVSLENDVFGGLPSIRRIDVSNNKINYIAKGAFSGLKNLERLKLNTNSISSIEKGTFDNLPSLKQLDISNNPLTCDCELLWLLEWSQNTSVKLLSSPKCSSPSTFKGQFVKKLKIGTDIHCTSPAGVRNPSYIELHPDQSQIVFEGDSLKLSCRAPSIPSGLAASELLESRAQVVWLWLDSDPKSHFSDINIENRYLAESGLVDTSVKIDRLNRNHTGEWICRLVSERGNHSKAILVVVISEDTKYCPVAVTRNNKGTYIWPKTVVGYTIDMPCQVKRVTDTNVLYKATHTCTENGDWKHFNTTACPYVSETTRILEQFSQIDLSLTQKNVNEIAQHLKNYTKDYKNMTDKMDIIFTAKTIQNYLNFHIDEDLGSALMDVINNIIEVPKLLFKEAHKKDKSCTKLVSAVELIAENVHLRQKKNIVAEHFNLKRDTYLGITCYWYSSANKKDRTFHCSSLNRSGLPNTTGRTLEASVQLPAGLFYQLQQVGQKDPSQSLFIGMYRNSKFFPLLGNTINQKMDVTSSIVGAKLTGLSVGNLTEPIYVVLRSPIPSEVSPPTPVWWNPNLNNGLGGWSTNGCHLSHIIYDLTFFNCDNLGYYGLLQVVNSVPEIKLGAKFHLSHPAVYVGSTVLFVCLLISVLTYLFCYSSIQMARKMKHSLINTWAAIFWLCFIYCFGIYQTEDINVCQIVGIVLHYTTLSTLLWLCVTANTMYKGFTKNCSQLPVDDGNLEKPVHKPILGLYLVGWGISLIVCGISGAINMKEYASYSYCFFMTVPALSAVFVPASILIGFILIQFLFIRCAIRNTDTLGQLSEGTEATTNVDLDLLEPPNERSSVRSTSVPSDSSDIEDPEHVPTTQLRAQIIVLFLFVVTWMNLALATRGTHDNYAYEEEVFSIIYALFASVLGGFILFFYCIARSDVRMQWVLMRSSLIGSSVCRTRNVSDTNQVMQIQLQPSVSNHTAEAIALSRSSSRSSHSKSQNGTVLKGADLNGVSGHHIDPVDAKISNVNLVVLHRQQYRSNNTSVIAFDPNVSADVFYNPHQIGVAKKFFRKQKRHMLKHNNLGIRRRGDGGNTSDGGSVVSQPRLSKKENVDSLLGSGSKINNTNIHVEPVSENKCNINLLSGQDEDIISSMQVQMERLMMANQLRRPHSIETPDESLKENNMRTVSQQCSLEYSSETLSEVAAADDLSLDEAELPVQNLTNELSRKIYVNPAHNLYLAQSCASSVRSSVSASEIDELYLQISRGPPVPVLPAKYRRRNSPVSLSDSDINGVSDIRFNNTPTTVQCESSDGDDKRETTV